MTRVVRTLLKSGIGFVLMMLGAMGGDGENLIFPIALILIGAWMIFSKSE